MPVKTTRPTPAVTSPNQFEAYFHQAEKLSQKIADRPGVIGVILSGGVSRGYADHLSEIDLVIYLDDRAYEDWIIQGKAPFPEGDSLVDGWHVDLEYVSFEQEVHEPWEHVKRWDRSYAIPLFDPKGQVQALIAEKAVFLEKEKERLNFQYFFLFGEYFIEFVVPAWIYRQDLAAAHQGINIAIDNLIKVLFLVNDELIPFEKWALNFTYSLHWKPPDWDDKIKQALLVQAFTEEDVRRRQVIVHDLLQACKQKIYGTDRNQLGVIEARKLDILKELRLAGALPAREFSKRFGERKALQSPFFQLVHREEREGTTWVVFDEAKLADQVSNGFNSYLDWDRKLLTALIAQKSI